ncbi:competence protein ComEA [Lactobacillus pentosus]|uniref:helix-hairpin-helix domain-containing protein n=1 Tax=Lactiplantibacillus pentosus TaxID=1589 RepID=UPI00128D8233|nr:helix-hairpin-helix domain-containing protein [Lactiplantibacillus pentosus]MPQ19525.1 competence protein ComEA [Lactiplantibacillus pentosus]
MTTWIQFAKNHWRVLAIVSAAVLILLTGLVLSQHRQPEAAVATNVFDPTAGASGADPTMMSGSQSSHGRAAGASSVATGASGAAVNLATTSSAPGFVDVKGAVNKPGLYQVTSSMRVADVIQLAQGMQPQADQQQVNLAAKVTDQQVVYVPAKGEQLPAIATATPSPTPATTTAGGGSPASTSAGSSEKVNLNTADVAAFQKLSGVGQKKAEKIIAYRQQHGNFKSVDDLKNVSGFGEKTVAKYKDQLTV